MSLIEQAKELWFEYYPIVVGFITVAGGIVASMIFVWTKVQPYLEKINLMKDKITDTSKEDVTNELKALTLETQVTDLKAKIANPTVSDELKQQYITQLARLETLKAKLEAGLVKVEETTSKF